MVPVSVPPGLANLDICRRGVQATFAADVARAIGSRASEI